MKITPQHLRRLIKEEANKVLLEQPPRWRPKFFNEDFYYKDTLMMIYNHEGRPAIEVNGSGFLIDHIFLPSQYSIKSILTDGEDIVVTVYVDPNNPDKTTSAWLKRPQFEAILAQIADGANSIPIPGYELLPNATVKPIQRNPTPQPEPEPEPPADAGLPAAPDVGFADTDPADAGVADPADVGSPDVSSPDAGVAAPDAVAPKRRKKIKVKRRKPVAAADPRSWGQEPGDRSKLPRPRPLKEQNPRVLQQQPQQQPQQQAQQQVRSPVKAVPNDAVLAVDRFVAAQAGVFSKLAKAASEKTAAQIDPTTQAPRGAGHMPAMGQGGSDVKWLLDYIRRPEFAGLGFKTPYVSLSSGLKIGDKVSLPNIKLVINKGFLHGFTIGGDLGEEMRVNKAFVQIPPIQLSRNVVASLSGGFTRHEETDDLSQNANVENLKTAQLGINYKFNPWTSLSAEAGATQLSKNLARKTQHAANLKAGISLKVSF